MNPLILFQGFGISDQSVLTTVHKLAWSSSNQFSWSIMIPSQQLLNKTDLILNIIDIILTETDPILTEIDLIQAKADLIFIMAK